MWEFFLSILKFVFVCFSPFIFSFFVAWFYLFIIKRNKLPKENVQRYLKYGSKFKRLFWLFPMRFWLDRIEKPVNFFDPYGVHIIAGEQGSGKTITLVYLLQRYKAMYPNVKIRTNMGYKYEDGVISHWKDIIHCTNGYEGQIEVIDEIQNWFNSMQSKDFPPEMLTEITQQRKQRKMIIGTSQVFTRVAKPIREQTTFLYEPFTLFGCLTVVRVQKPRLDADGQLEEKKLSFSLFTLKKFEIVLIHIRKLKLFQKLVLNPKINKLEQFLIILLLIINRFR